MIKRVFFTLQIFNLNKQILILFMLLLTKVCEVLVIELNPFLNTTDGALFSWEHERTSILENTEQFTFRITEKARTGARAMLPLNLRQLLQETK